MNFRGIARLAVAAAFATLFVGVLGAPAQADNLLPFLALNIGDPILAADAPVKGCAGIDDGTAQPGKDGWLFGKPSGEYTDLQYVFGYSQGEGDVEGVTLLLNNDGIFTLNINWSALSQSGDLRKSLTATSSRAPITLPTLPAPAGVTGKIVDGGGWVKSPKGWSLVYGFAITDPLLDSGSFDLVRACAAAESSTPPSPQPTTSPSSQPAVSASASHPAGGSGGGELPKTGSNVWVLSGIGLALVLAGTVLFVAYRRGRNVNFVA